MHFLNLETRYNNNFAIFFEKTLIFINLLLPLALITGPFFSDLIIVVSSIIFIFFSIIEKKFFFYRNIFFLIFIIIYLFFLIKSFTSADILFSLESSLFYFRFGFFALSLWYVLTNYKKFSLLLFYSLLFTIIFVCLDAIYQFYSGYNSLGFEYDAQRLSGFFGEELKLGSYISRLLPVLVALFIYNFEKINTKFFFILVLAILISLFTVFLSGERVSSFYIIILYFSLFLFSLKKLKLFTIFFISSIIILLTFTLSDKAFNTFTYRNIISTIEQSNFQILTNNNQIREKTIEYDFKSKTSNESFNIIFNKINDLFNSFDGLSLITLYEKIKNDEIYIFSDSYHKIYKLSFKIIERHFPYGIGPKLFRKECRDLYYYKNLKYNYENEGMNSFDPSDDYCTTHPHNIHLQIFVETGLIGFIISISIFIIILILLFVNLINYFINNKNNSAYKFFLFLALFLTFFPFQPTGSFFNNWNSIIYYFPVGFILKEIYSNNK